MRQRKGTSRAAAGWCGNVIQVEHADMGEFVLRCPGDPVLLFTEDATNNELLWGVCEPDRQHLRRRCRAVITSYR